MSKPKEKGTSVFEDLEKKKYEVRVVTVSFEQ